MVGFMEDYKSIGPYSTKIKKNINMKIVSMCSDNYEQNLFFSEQ